VADQDPQDPEVLVMRPIKKSMTAKEAADWRGLLADSKPANPKACLDPIGEKTYSLLVKVEQQWEIVYALWRHYLADCQRNGVRPYDPERIEEAEGGT